MYIRREFTWHFYTRLYSKTKAKIKAIGYLIVLGTYFYKTCLKYFTKLLGVKNNGFEMVY